MNTHLFDLESPLISFGDKTGETAWTIRNSFEGLCIFGSNGSGKSSGSGSAFAHKLISHQFGGLVLTAKADEKDAWVSYCKKHNRLDDLIIVEPNGKHCFNFLEYEASKKPDGKTITENIVQVLKTVIRASQEKAGGFGGDSQFWESALDMLIFHVIDLCLLAFGTLRIQDMYDVVMSAPKREMTQQELAYPSRFMEALKAAQINVDGQVLHYVDSLSNEEKDTIKDSEIFDKEILDKIPDAGLLKLIDEFFMQSYRMLAEKTRSIIDFSFSGFLFRLLKEPVYSLFCRNTSTFTPEDCLDGKIILLNLPVKQYDKIGRDIQVMFKYIWQRAMEKRDVKKNGRPVFLYADEGHLFLHEHDPIYQATARSSRISTVLISQNLSNYYASMGGEKPEHRVKSLLGTLVTKIFHANADDETNEYASKLIGDGYTEDFSSSNTVAGEFSSTQSSSFSLERMVRPEEFARLKTGGPDNGLIVEGYIHRPGRPFHTDMNHLKIAFRQQTDLSS